MLLRPGLFCRIWDAEAVKFYNIAKTEAEVITKIVQDFSFAKKQKQYLFYSM